MSLLTSAATNWEGALCGCEFAWEVTGNVVANADDELTTARLRDAEFPRFLDLRLHAIAKHIADAVLDAVGRLVSPVRLGQ